MNKFFLWLILLAWILPIHGQKVVRVNKGYVALQHENVGANNEQLIIRRPVNGKLINIGMVQVVISKQGKTAAKIIKQFGSYRIRPGDYAFQISKPDKINKKAESFPVNRPWRFRIGFGPGKRIGDLSQNIPPEFQSYHDKLKSGLLIASDITFYYKSTAGVGLAFSQWSTRNSVDDQFIYDNESTIVLDQVDMENQLKIMYVGPALVIRQPIPNSKINFNAQFTAGYLQFRDKQTMVFILSNPVEIQKETIQGDTFGMGGQLGLEYSFNPSFGIYGNLAFLFGTLPKQKTESNLYQDRISLNRLDIQLGFSIAF